MYLCVSVCMSSQRLEVGAGSYGTGILGSCELPNVGVGNPTQVPWRSKKCC